MARAIKHKLTPAEVACGVTLEQVADLPPHGSVHRPGMCVRAPANTPPADLKAIRL